jgi:hypothetical protein
MLPRSSELKSKPSKKPADAGSKLNRLTNSLRVCADFMHGLLLDLQDEGDIFL